MSISESDEIFEAFKRSGESIAVYKRLEQSGRRISAAILIEYIQLHKPLRGLQVHEEKTP